MEWLEKSDLKLTLAKVEVEGEAELGHINSFQDSSAPLDYNNLVVCNYAKAGNFLNSVMYQTGAACSACPAGYGCEDGLCAKTV